MKNDTLNSYQERILRVLIYIQNNLDKKLSLEELAKVACFSQYHFHRVFKGMVGEALSEYLRRLRIERAAFQLKQNNLSITDIAFFASYETLESFSRAFQKHFGVSPSKYRKEEKNLKLSIEENGKNIELIKSKGVVMDVNIRNLKKRKVLFVRHVGPYKDCGSAWKKLCTWAGTRGLLTRNTQYLGLCHDDPEVTAAEKIRYDACVAIDTNVEVSGDIGMQEIAAGDFAITLHKGPYENLKDSYAELFGSWAPSSGRELKEGPSVEIYLNDPNTTVPEKLEVEIQVPLL